MPEALMRCPITCPECAMEWLAEFPIVQISNALKAGKTIRLYARCHDKYWDATFVERIQLREYLDAATGEARQYKDAPEQSAEHTESKLHQGEPAASISN
jgi:hypothetical protein